MVLKKKQTLFFRLEAAPPRSKISLLPLSAERLSVKELKQLIQEHLGHQRTWLEFAFWDFLMVFLMVFGILFLVELFFLWDFDDFYCFLNGFQYDYSKGFPWFLMFFNDYSKGF